MVVAVFAALAVVGVLASVGVERLLHSHLRRVLTDICESDARSAFFAVVAGLVIVLTGALAATSTTGYADPNAAGFDLLSGALTQARILMAGLVGVVIVLAFLLIGAIRRYEALRRPLPPPARWTSAPPVPGEPPR